MLSLCVVLQIFAKKLRLLALSAIIKTVLVQYKIKAVLVEQMEFTLEI